MRALHFGAGNIGRGFIGQLLHESGYEITFVDVRNDLVDALNKEALYEVVLADEFERRVPVGPVSALHAENGAEKVLRSIAEVDLVTTSVGPFALPALAPVLAEGLMERARGGGSAVNVIACENMVGASQALRASVMERVPARHVEAVEEISGFPNAAVDRIVPDQSEAGLDVLVEPFFEWVVDSSQVEGERPEIPYVTYVGELSPYLERKLLTVNTGHCAAAYLGYAYGSLTVQAALEVEHIREEVAGALEETGTLLTAEYGFGSEEQEEYARKAISRFRNPRIRDDVGRVARAPIRKLGRDERLVSPALRLLEMGHEPVHLAGIVGALLSYDEPGDQESKEMQRMLRTEGLRTTLALYAGIEEDHLLVDLVESSYYGASAEERRSARDRAGDNGRPS